MGCKFSKLSECLSDKESRILILGFDAAGKTTILYNLQLGEVIRSFPTVGFNVETLDYKNARFVVWDVGGQENMRHLWREYIGKSCKGVVYVVDSGDRECIYEAIEMLHRIMSEQSLRNVALLLFANKQDSPNAMTCDEISEKLDLQSLTQCRCHVQGSCAISGKGLLDGLDWLSNNVQGFSFGKHSMISKFTVEDLISRRDYKIGFERRLQIL
ncbi:hypothetical protein SUGI_0573870 [Cryptomeria japonica]|uniref:ADP-ribosylation factor 2-B-like n=1 Tax=Cryptomeria japonica TaxID=3369 RepID=UPI002408D55B|nr:ADP-ribosylation factor 2-B-like [Cryptomeria japonica]GLJ29105.1 hypothetical protein SUGI_0573870 [Cryptomeria japonica]